MAKATRKSTPRVKTGCPTCRIRRVKCDETRPACLRCTQTGRKCDGYQQATPALACVRRPSPMLLEPTAYSIPFRMPGGQRDRQLLHYFCVQGAAELSGFVSNDFWSRTALLASQDEAIVRQSLIALSSLHLDLSLGNVDKKSVAGRETLAHYGKALRSLQARITQTNLNQAASGMPRYETTKTTLICCILFHCFESTMGETQAAMNHLDNGLQLLAARDRQQQPDASDEDICILRDTFARLDLQATFFDDRRTPKLALVTREERMTGLVACPHDTFYSIGDAQAALVRLQHWMMRFLQENVHFQWFTEEDIPPEVLAEKNRLRGEFERWAQRFERLVAIFDARQSSAKVKEDRAVRMLHAQHAFSQMLLIAKIPDRLEAFGCVPNIEARRLVDLCEGILLEGTGWAVVPVSSASGGSSRPASRSLSSETGVVVGLYLLAMKCVDEAVTEKAVEVLIACQRREGLYDALQMATLVQRLKGKARKRLREWEELGHGPWVDVALEYWITDLINDARAGSGALVAVVDRMFKEAASDSLST